MVIGVDLTLETSSSNLIPQIYSFFLFSFEFNSFALPEKLDKGEQKFLQRNAWVSSSRFHFKIFSRLQRFSLSYTHNAAQFDTLYGSFKSS